MSSLTEEDLHCKEKKQINLPESEMQFELFKLISNISLVNLAAKFLIFITCIFFQLMC